MGFYRKKPIIVEAHQLTAENYQTLKIWCKSLVGRCAEWGDNGAGPEGSLAPPALVCISPAYIVLKTIGGDTNRAMEGDYIVKDVLGFFYRCDAEVFQATHEEV